MESEKVKEIKKALNCCANWNGQSSCNDCPIGLEKCFENENLMPQLALTLINELESEKEALQKGVKRLKKRYEETTTKNADECVKKFCETTVYKEQEKLVNENQQLKDRIAELENKCDDCAGCTQWKCDCANIEMHAVKQFAERVKMEFYAQFDELIPSIMADKIDNILKEFLK